MKSLREKHVGMRLLVIVSLVSLLLGAGVSEFLSGSSVYPRLRSASASPEPESGSTTPVNDLPDFVSLARKLKPAVVNISTVQVAKEPETLPGPFGEEDPFNEFWKRFFGGPFPHGTQRQKSLGSGFIINKDGTILTNFHVVDNAEEIKVRLSDEREFDAKVLGRDQKTDIAIVKIDTREDLPVAPLGDSDRLKIGEWVMAIGNPFGLDSTVTAGIVSAKGRQIGAGPYDDFIQTDASINPGNSGGPLINTEGAVVGINTAIFSQSGGNIGIGFATPINLVKELLPQLKEKGKVVRGYLGVVIQKVTPDIAESLGLDKARGALVAEVSKNGPAGRAGIKVGDVIVEFDGKEIRDSSDLPILVAREAPGKQVQLKVLRDKKELSLSATLGNLEESPVVASSSEEGGLGLTVQKVTPEIARSLGLDRAQGVVITSVKPGSPADDADLRRGDVILEINRQAVSSLADYKKALSSASAGKPVLLLVRRGETTLFLALKR